MRLERLVLKLLASAHGLVLEILVRCSRSIAITNRTVLSDVLRSELIESCERRYFREQCKLDLGSECCVVQELSEGPPRVVVALMRSAVI